MPTVQGDELVIEVQDPLVPATWVPINDANRFSRRTARTTTKTRVFMRATPYVNRSQRESTATLSGFVNTDDPGQQILRDAMEADTIVKIRVLPDGVNGFSQDFYVNNQGADANPEPQNMQECSWELIDAADPVQVLTGPIL